MVRVSSRTLQVLNWSEWPATDNCATGLPVQRLHASLHAACCFFFFWLMLWLLLTAVPPVEEEVEEEEDRCYTVSISLSHTHTLITAHVRRKMGRERLSLGR